MWKSDATSWCFVQVLKSGKGQGCSYLNRARVEQVKANSKVGSLSLSLPHLFHLLCPVRIKERKLGGREEGSHFETVDMHPIISASFYSNLKSSWPIALNWSVSHQTFSEETKERYLFMMCVCIYKVVVFRNCSKSVWSTLVKPRPGNVSSCRWSLSLKWHLIS